MILKNTKKHLIGTFCIVNEFNAYLTLSDASFNRNILYCKCEFTGMSQSMLRDLIGTFCIVNINIP